MVILILVFSGKQNGRGRDSVTQQLVPDILLPLFSPWILSWTSNSYHIERGNYFIPNSNVPSRAGVSSLVAIRHNHVTTGDLIVATVVQKWISLINTLYFSHFWGKSGDRENVVGHRCSRVIRV